MKYFVLFLLTLVIIFEAKSQNVIETEESKPASKSKPEKPSIKPEKPPKLEYDFQKNSFLHSNSLWIKERDGLEFTITNINLFKYKVIINNSRFDLLNSENSILNNNAYNNMTSMELYNTQFIAEINKLMSTESSLILKSDNLEDRIKLLQSGLEEETFFASVQLQVDEINKITDSFRIPDSETKNHLLSIEWLHQGILYYNDLFILLQSVDSASDLLGKRDAITNKFYSNRIASNGEDFRYCIAYNQLISSRQRLIVALNKRIEYVQFLIEKLGNSKILFESINDPGGRISSLNSELNQLIITSNELLNRYRLVLDILNSNKIDELANEVQRIYNSFDIDNFTVNVKEFDLENIDVVELEVSIEPQSNALGYFSRKESFTSTIRTYGGLRFDVSAGLMFNFNLNNRSYSYTPTGIAGDSLSIVRQKDNNSYIPFVGSQLNVYINKPFKQLISPGLALGVSTNLTDEIRYYLGGCLVLGNKDRIIFSYGVSGGQIEMLSGKYTINTPYLASTLPDVPELTKAFRLGTFLSITYNLSSGKAKVFGEEIQKAKY